MSTPHSLVLVELVGPGAPPDDDGHLSAVVLIVLGRLLDAGELEAKRLQLVLELTRQKCLGESRTTKKCM